jgi:hypothetical protein
VLAADHVCQREVEAMGEEEAKRAFAALGSEVVQLKNPADEIKSLAPESSKCSPEAGEKQLPVPHSGHFVSFVGF